MSLFRKFFGVSSSQDDSSKKGKEDEFSSYMPEATIPFDELFMINFKKNGGKFIYCDSLAELKIQFENILEENDWFERQVMCFDPKLFGMLQDNKLEYQEINTPEFLFTSCENLIADEGSVLFSSNQIRHYKSNELPVNIVVFATTSQIVGNKSDSLREIKKKYGTHYPSNITAIKYFEKLKDENFLNYGSAPKNMYLLLLEDL